MQPVVSFIQRSQLLMSADKASAGTTQTPPEHAGKKAVSTSRRVPPPSWPS